MNYTVFERVGVNYVGPIAVKHRPVQKSTVIKAHICVFISLTVKAMHLELVSDLTTEAFIASLRRFIACNGKPSLIWNDHCTNFISSARELKELNDFLSLQKTSLITVPHTTLCGTSYLSVIPTLVASGRQQ